MTRRRQRQGFWSRWTPGWMKSERFKLSVFALAVVLTPFLMALAGASDVPEGERSAFYWQLGGLWLVGALVGLALVLVYAARGKLIIRDPSQVGANRTRNLALGAALVPVAVGLALLLPHLWPTGVDARVLVVIAICGFLFPMMPVLLYVTFRIRPDEMFSEDPDTARAAERRLRGDDAARDGP